MLLEMPTGTVKTQGWRQSPDRDSSVSNTRRISGSDAVGADSGKAITATGDGDTESSTSGCESSSTDRVRTGDAHISLGTTPTTATVAATATLLTGLA